MLRHAMKNFRQASSVSSRAALSTKTLESLAQASHSVDDSALSLLGTALDVRRFDTLVHAGPMDFRGVVHEVPNEDLDWNTTIFHTITDPQLTERLKKRFGQRPLWPDSVIRAACDQAIHLAPQQYFVPPPILDFMQSNCEFKNEHADGGFMDHLDFCAEYIDSTLSLMYGDYY